MQAATPASPLGASALSSASPRSPSTAQGAPLTEKQVETFQATQRAVLAEDTAFLASFPELPALLQEFTKAVLQEKPSNIRQFAAEYFARPVEQGPS